MECQDIFFNMQWANRRRIISVASGIQPSNGLFRKCNPNQRAPPWDTPLSQFSKEKIFPLYLPTLLQWEEEVDAAPNCSYSTLLGLDLHKLENSISLSFCFVITYPWDFLWIKSFRVMSHGMHQVEVKNLISEKCYNVQIFEPLELKKEILFHKHSNVMCLKMERLVKSRNCNSKDACHFFQVQRFSKF